MFQCFPIVTSKVLSNTLYIRNYFLQGRCQMFVLILNDLDEFVFSKNVEGVFWLQ